MVEAQALKVQIVSGGMDRGSEVEVEEVEVAEIQVEVEEVEVVEIQVEVEEV